MKEKKLTGYASIDDPQSKNSSPNEKYPLIPGVNVYTLLKLLSFSFSGKTAVDSLDMKVSYDEFMQDVVTISKAFKEVGVKRGDIVSVSMPNLYQALTIFFAANRIGAVTSYLNAAATPSEIEGYLNEFESPVFVNYDKTIEENQKIYRDTKVKYIVTLDKKNLRNRILNKDYRIMGSDSLIDFNALGTIAEHQKYSIERHFNAKDTALLQFTSGTTGKPKVVELTNNNIISAELYAKATSHTENLTGNKVLVSVPFCYPYGLVTSALTTLLWGKEAILAPDISKDTINYYYDKKPNIVFGSPALLDLTMKYLEEGKDLSQLTNFISGGDFLSLNHANVANEFFVKHGANNVELGNGFGNAETVSIGSTPVGVPLRQETAGKILVGSHVMIADPDSYEEKKYGEEGTLLVSGKHVFKGYYNNPSLTAQSIIKIKGRRYFNTGTLGKIDEDGYFTPTGRQSRFYIMSSLNKVYCDFVQSIIATYPYIKDCAVVEVPDEENLYVNKVYVVLKDGSYDYNIVTEDMKKRFDEPTINTFGNNVQLKPYEKPTYIEFIGELPRKAGSDKVDYDVLKEDAIIKLNNKNKVLTKE